METGNSGVAAAHLGALKGNRGWLIRELLGWQTRGAVCMACAGHCCER